jgi:hypothetical protein
LKPAVALLDQFMKAGIVSPDLKAADLVKALISSGLINAEVLASPYLREALPNLGQHFDENVDEATKLLGLQKSGRPKNSAPYRQEDERLLIEGALRHRFRHVQERDLEKISNTPKDATPEQVDLSEEVKVFMRRFVGANTGKPHEIMHELALNAPGTCTVDHRRKRLVRVLNHLDMTRYGLKSVLLVQLRDDLKATPKGPARNQVRKKK